MEQVKESDMERLREHLVARGVGFDCGLAQIYLEYCDMRETCADAHIFTTLIEIDTKLGKTANQQLDWCLTFAIRLDLIKV